MISIVIVSLNTKNNLNKTIKSILHQTSKKFEIIILMEIVAMDQLI